MFRRIERHYADSGCEHAVHVPAALAVDAGRISDQANPLSTDGAEAFIRPDIEACFDLAVPRDIAMQARTGQRLVVPSEAGSLRCNAHGGGHYGCDLSPQ